MFVKIIEHHYTSKFLLEIIMIICRVNYQIKNLFLNLSKWRGRGHIVVTVGYHGFASPIVSYISNLRTLRMPTHAKLGIAYMHVVAL